MGGRSGSSAFGILATAGCATATAVGCATSPPVDANAGANEASGGAGHAGTSGAGAASSGGAASEDGGSGGNGGTAAGGDGGGGPNAGAGGTAGENAGGASGAAGAGGTASTCAGGTMIVDWVSNYDIKLYGTLWSVGASPPGYGPGDGRVYLATVPAGIYSPNAEATAMLAPRDLSAFADCQITMTFDLWRFTESGDYDGGNLQATTDPDPDGSTLSSNSWQVVGDYPGAANYDAATLVSASCAACYIAAQPVWSGSLQRQKSVEVDLSEYAGAASLALRFTFHANGTNSWDGLYIGNITFVAQ